MGRSPRAATASRQGGNEAIADGIDRLLEQARREVESTVVAFRRVADDGGI